MKKITIAFDCDGTLISDDDITPNSDIVSLLIILSKFKNTKIIVWSGRGEQWARQVAIKLNITQYIDIYMDKNYLGIEDGKHIFSPKIKPDIAIDDIQMCDLGLINLIVRCK